MRFYFDLEDAENIGREAIFNTEKGVFRLLDFVKLF